MSIYGRPSGPASDPYEYPRAGAYPSGESPYATDLRHGGQVYRGAEPMPQGAVWGPAQAPPRRGGPGVWIAIAVVAVLLIGGGGTALYLLQRGTGTGGGAAQAPQANGQPTAAGSTPASGPAASTQSKPAAGPNPDTRAAKEGDCLVNRGTEGTPEMRKVACAKDTYEVLKRIDGTMDKARCDGIPKLTDWYYYDNVDNSLDFVLCLRKRT